MNKPRKYIFITGGVLSSIGKGISAASIGMLMESRGLKVTMIKMDPYLNVDPGTMSPFQHGEVFVLDDGSETDLDLGHYSRFVQNAHFTKKNSFTTGRIYDSVIRKERAGKYLGKTVQVIPHITDEIKDHIRAAAEGYDLAIIEVGGTIGDIEGLPFFEAIRQFRYEEGAENVAYVHLTLVPYIITAGELKTKPTQHSVKQLREIGIQPDILLCRSDRPLSQGVKEKIGLFCNVPREQVFSAKDVNSIYELPLYFKEDRLDEKISEILGIWSGTPNLKAWKKMVQTIQNPEFEVSIGVVGKYTDGKDSYKSLVESLVHGGVGNSTKVNPVFLDSSDIEEGNLKSLEKMHGILVPGGFGERGVEGKIKAIQYARENDVPYFGICLGMQLAVVEFARNVCGIKDSNSKEFDENGKSNVIDLMESQKEVKDKGGTMRLGAYQCKILETYKGSKTKAYIAYGQKNISERHRHRYEVNNVFRSQIEEAGLVVSGKHIDKEKKLDLVEMIEINDHSWFLGCQFHPEFLSKPLKPHPLFQAFIEAALKRKAT